jgi:ADP-ribose pyrophosphatase
LKGSGKTGESRVIHRGRVFDLIREKIALPNGAAVEMDLIRHPGASAIVPLKGDDLLIMIRQYRHAVGGYIWEIPAGTLDPRETPIECARRELVEETGFSASSWERLGEIVPVPGYSDERIHLFLATDLAPAHQDLDGDGVLDVHEIRLQDALKMISQGEIQDGKTIAGLFLAREWLHARDAK